MQLILQILLLELISAPQGREPSSLYKNGDWFLHAEIFLKPPEHSYYIFQRGLIADALLLKRYFLPDRYWQKLQCLKHAPA